LEVSIICCYYNEINLLKSKLHLFIDYVQKKKLEIEIIIVDNHSNDGSTEFLKKISDEQNDSNIKFIFNDKNLGKGGSIKKACSIATGKLACIFDIDEYLYQDLFEGIEYFKNNKIDLLIGSRILKKKMFIYKKNFYGVIALTSLINKLYNLKLTDAAGATKLFKLDLYKKTKIFTSGFNFEFELICKFAKKKFIINEYPSTFNPRTYAEGKKVDPWKDGIKILLTIIRSYFI
jgi:glycosyltransferase involved in cell wall biosynthesis